MQDYTILIADDEKLAREAVKFQLANYPHVQILAECTNGKQALEQILQQKPDIIFLDIQMPVLNGLEILQQLPAAYHPAIIFVTAYDTYALQAFENDAIDYLLKPFTDNRFDKAFQKALKICKSQQSNESLPEANLTERLKKVLQQFQHESTNTISIKDGAKFYILPLQDIMYVEAAGDYLVVFTVEKKYLHKETLSNLENTLPSHFVRIHKSYIVNTVFIKELHSQFNGDYTVLLKGGQQLKLSRNYRERLSHLLS